MTGIRVRIGDHPNERLIITSNLIAEKTTFSSKPGSSLLSEGVYKMRKSTLFISAALTTFMLAVMFGVASAYQKIVKTGGIPTESAVQQVQPTDVMVATPGTTAATVTLEQAAALASNVIGRTDLYTAENAQLDGVDSYLVTFSSGDIVYVSLDGKIMSISKLPVVFIASQSSSQAGGGGGGGGGGHNGSNASSSSNNGGDEHGDEGGGDD
jgi:uncharacterized membrane protein YgcG